MHSAVQPVSHVRLSCFETLVLSFVIFTGKAGDWLTFTLRLAIPVVSPLHVQPQVQSILAHLIFTDFIEMLEFFLHDWSQLQLQFVPFGGLHFIDFSVTLELSSAAGLSLENQ